MLATTIGLGSLQLNSQPLSAESEVLFIYGDFYPENVSGYDLIILEGAHFSTQDIMKLKQQNGKVLGYISLGEVSESAAHYPELKEVVLGKNDIWNSYVLDIGNSETIEALQAIIDHSMDKGMHGMFLDNIDNYTKFGPTPAKKDDLLDFLERIKNKYPEIYLFQNAGIPVISETSEYIDAVAKESIATNYNFENRQYQLRKDSEFQVLLNELKIAHNEFDIPVVLIEYADEPSMKSDIKNRLSEFNWPVFIGKIDLQTIPERD